MSAVPDQRDGTAEAAAGQAAVGHAGAARRPTAQVIALHEWRAPLAESAELAVLAADVGGPITSGETRRARAWLSRTVEPGSLAVHRLLAARGPVATMNLIKSGGAPDRVQRLAAARHQDDRALADLAAADRLGIRLVTPEDDEWPDEALHAMEVAASRGAPDLAPPQALWVRGPLRLDHAVARAVGIVGSRSASGYGTWIASTIAYSMAGKGWMVISGGAHGIDTAAHRGALAAGGGTVAVIACGLGRPYPSGNASLFERVADAGLLISEWPPDCPPQRHRFLVRNRLIAALTAGTVVVEAGRRSGARSTARRARDLGRVVMAVPGPATSAMSIGPHEMIREDGAYLVTSGDHVVELVGAIGDDLAPLSEVTPTPRDGLDAVARRVLDGLPSRGATSADRIAVSAGIPVQDVLRCLPTLEMGGFVRADSDGWRLTAAGRR
jgi:DNA processing protein